MIIDISAFKNALEQLKTSLAYLQSDLSQDKGLYAQFRSATIQAFKYSYELSHKSLKRFFKMTMPSQDVIEDMTFSELIRTGYEKGLLQNSWSQWKLY